MTTPVMSLFGPSGSGKTSILSMIAGFIQPERGHIRIGEHVVFDSEKRISVPCEGRGIGVVFQDHLLFPHMNVESNLRYGARRQRETQAIDFPRVCDVLDLKRLLHRYPRNLSGGERQRVAIGRALLSSPRLLIMDEPLASLDGKLKSRVLSYLERIVHEWDLPTVFVSHGQGDVRRLANWVVVIENGQVVARGTPEDALTHSRPLGWRNSMGPVNLLRIEKAVRRDDYWAATVGQDEIHLPNVDDSTIAPTFVQFSPADVILSRRDVRGLSTRNHLHGTIRQVAELPDRIFVAIDVGQIVWSEVTNDAAVELALRPGNAVTCMIKTQSLHLVR